jgi:hypothetical protein
MPIHINKYRGFEKQLTLAREALLRNQADIQDGMIVNFMRVSKCQWHEIMEGLNEIDISSLKLSKNEKAALRVWLHRHNFKRTAPGKYERISE